jgi:hypothetical protein
MRNNKRRNNQSFPQNTQKGAETHAERSVFRYVRAKSKALALHTLLHIDCKAGALLLIQRSEGRYAEQGSLKRCMTIRLMNHILNFENKFNNNLIINDLKYK